VWGSRGHSHQRKRAILSGGGGVGVVGREGEVGESGELKGVGGVEGGGVRTLYGFRGARPLGGKGFERNQDRKEDNRASKAQERSKHRGRRHVNENVGGKGTPLASGGQAPD